MKAAVVPLLASAMLLGSAGLSHGFASSPSAVRGEAGSGARADAESGARASIVGGTVGSIASYPWLAFIDYRGPVDEFSCGGTVVSPRLVLTAAHCVLTGTGRVGVAANFSVLTGVGDLREAAPERVSKVSQVVVFPEYEPAQVMNDVALLILAAPVATPPLPFATPSDQALLAKGTPVAVAGWGLTEVSPPRLPAVLRQAQLAVQASSSCERALRRFVASYQPASQICVKSQGGASASLCNGDSGGPAVARRPDGSLVQIGVISMKGSLDCDPRTPQVLARADRASAWIASWLAAVESGAPAPAVVVPRVELPPVTRRDAEVIAWLGLEGDFRNRFTRGKYHQIACRRLNREKVKCQVQWVRGAQLYRGAITIYAALPREGFVYNFRYTIRRFPVSCWITHLNPIQACNPALFKR